MTPADRFARWVSIPANQNAILLAMCIAGFILLWLASDYSPIEAVRPN